MYEELSPINFLERWAEWRDRVRALATKAMQAMPFAVQQQLADDQPASEYGVPDREFLPR